MMNGTIAFAINLASLQPKQNADLRTSGLTTGKASDLNFLEITEIELDFQGISLYNYNIAKIIGGDKDGRCVYTAHGDDR